MFAKISLNENTNNGKSIHQNSLKNKAHNYSLGTNEWQQKWETTNNRLLIEKPVNIIL